MSLFKIVILFAMLANSASASAEWIHIAAAPTFLGFANLDDVEVSDTLHRVWILQNYPEQQSKGFRSVRARCEYDCSMNRGRVVEEEWWTEHWAMGSNITPANSPVDQRWIKPPQGSFGDLILKILCGATVERQ